MDNGHAGYLLKPAYMRNKSKKDPSLALIEGKVKKLTIRIYGARQLPKPHGQTDKSEVIDPYVRANIHGCAADQKEFKTKTIPDNGFNPDWNETFTFTFTQSHLAILTFLVEDEDAVGFDHIAHFSIPVESIRPGYRVVHLQDNTYSPINKGMCNLFCHFRVE
eukprot:TRINITY_DN77395_c0_g1_i1.p1 TRINITY_DN77395_c0_g1~~TRINITY_DN77395_c0_g1_i1.p1  ORF type:complete len:186 (-),score=21.27 TRINITY_DN77395_c0_g1_i1:35-523(-)